MRRPKPRRNIYGFTHRLNQALYHSGLSQSEFAERMELRRETVTRYLNGQHVPDALTLAEIGNVLDVSTDWLLYGDVRGTPAWIL